MRVVSDGTQAGGGIQEPRLWGCQVGGVGAAEDGVVCGVCGGGGVCGVGCEV